MTDYDLINVDLSDDDLADVRDDNDGNMMCNKFNQVKLSTLNEESSE